MKHSGDCATTHNRQPKKKCNARTRPRRFIEMRAQKSIVCLCVFGVRRWALLLPPPEYKLQGSKKNCDNWNIKRFIFANKLRQNWRENYSMILCYIDWHRLSYRFSFKDYTQQPMALTIASPFSPTTLIIPSVRAICARVRQSSFEFALFCHSISLGSSPSFQDPYIFQHIRYSPCVLRTSNRQQPQFRGGI